MTGYDIFGVASHVAERLDIPYEEARTILHGVERDLVALEWERADEE